jgi:hypothetical protein
MGGQTLSTGFETPKELQEFNAKYQEFGVLAEEVWPLPKRTFEFRLPGFDVGTIVRSRDDVIEFERRRGLCVRYSRDFMDWVRDECLREGTPLMQLNTSLHEACHLVAGDIAGFPHTELIGPRLVCSLEKTAGALKITHVRYEPAAAAFDPDAAKRFYTEKPIDYAAMLLAPLCVMPRLMPSTTKNSLFVPDITALMRHVPGQEDTAGLEAAVALTDDPKFLERVKVSAGKLRQLIRQGGKTQLSRNTSGDRARSASAGSDY